MPIGRGNFNKRRVSATKERKVKERVAKKLQASKQNHNSKKVAVSGQRTGVFTEREESSSLRRLDTPDNLQLCRQGQKEA